MDLISIKKSTSQHIIKYAIPSIIAMTLTSLITVVDGFFIGNYVGKEGIVAVNLGLPILYVYLAIGIMIGVGGVSIAGRLLGSQKIKACNSVFNQTTCVTFVVMITLSFILLISINPLVNLFNIANMVKAYINSYYSIMICVYPFMMLNTVFGMFIRGEGKPESFMKVTIITLLTNIVLDYIFISRFQLGIKGIAFASLISVLLGLGLMISYFLKKSRVFKIGRFEFSKKTLQDTFLNGSSEFIGQLSMSITLFAFNWVIMREVGLVGVAAFTVVGYSSYIFNMIVIGFGQGASPLISFSYGAGEWGLCHRIRKLTNRFIIVVGILVFVLMNITASWYSQLLVKSIEVEKMVRDGIPIFTIAFLFLGVNVISSFYFTSIGKAKESALISASRGLIVLMICILLLPSLFGMTGVWLVAPATEIITLGLTLMLINRDGGYRALSIKKNKY